MVARKLSVLYLAGNQGLYSRSFCSAVLRTVSAGVQNVSFIAQTMSAARRLRMHQFEAIRRLRSDLDAMEGSAAYLVEVIVHSESECRLFLVDRQYLRQDGWCPRHCAFLLHFVCMRSKYFYCGQCPPLWDRAGVLVHPHV